MNTSLEDDRHSRAGRRVRPEGRRRLSLWLKIPYTIFVAILIPVWVRHQGWENFLWLSDIGLLATCIAIWLESRLLASMMAVGVVLPDLAWGVLFLGRLLIDAGPLEQTGDMFDENIPLWVRGLSLYHLVVPPLLLWMVQRLGYDRRALPAQIALTVVVLPLSYLLVAPAENVNFVYGFGEPPQSPVPQPLWLGLQLVILVVATYLPVHFVLARWCGDGPRAIA